MKMGAKFWEGHVAAATRETISASEYAGRHNISVAALYFWQPVAAPCAGTSASSPNR